MNNFEYLIKFRIGILISIILFLLGSHSDAITMVGKETISGGGNIGGMFDPLGAASLIKGNVPSINILGGPFITPQGLGTLPGMNSPEAIIAGAELIVGMNSIIPGPASSPVMLPNIFPAMGQIPLSLSWGPVITNMMVPGIIGLFAMNPLMMGPNLTNPLIMLAGSMCPMLMVPDIMSPLSMCPGPICPFMIGPGHMNIMVMPDPMSPFKIGLYPTIIPTLSDFPSYFATVYEKDFSTDTISPSCEDPEIGQLGDCISQTIYKNVEKGNIVLMEVDDGCTGRIYHGYPAGAWLPAALETSPQPLADYRWWYGCSATCAGMMMAYYDRYPYYVDGNTYDLIPGGIAEYESFLTPDPWYLADSTINEIVRLCNRAIASEKHAFDFWTYPSDPSASFGSTVDPLASIRKGDPAGFDCLADFMGTSQNELSGTRGNPDGITWFWFPSDGSILSSEPISWPSWYDFNYSGMYGLVEWARYCQTISGQSMNAYAYNQYIEGYTPPTGPAPVTGFSFYDYQVEIDNGRPVMFLLMDWSLEAGHSVLGVGYGYNSVTAQAEVYIHDTWTLNSPADPKTIPWTNDLFSYSVNISGTLRTYNFEIIGITTFQPNKL